MDDTLIGLDVLFVEYPSHRAGAHGDRPYAAKITDVTDLPGNTVQVYVYNSLHPRFELARHDPTGQEPGTWRYRATPTLEEPLPSYSA